jgi:hypothetical protein
VVTVDGSFVITDELSEEKELNSVGANGFGRPGVTGAISMLLSLSEINDLSLNKDVSILILIKDDREDRKDTSIEFVSEVFELSKEEVREFDEESAASNLSLLEKYKYTPPIIIMTEIKTKNFLYPIVLIYYLFKPISFNF